MARNTLVLLAILMVGCADDGRPTKPLPPPGRWIVSDMLASVAMLQIDYATYRFEGGTIRQFAQQFISPGDSIPLAYRSYAPGDFGWSAFTYPDTGDTVFFGTTVWTGRGDRTIPRELIPADSFAVVADSGSAPQSLTYFPSNIGTTPLLRAKADSAWSAVQRLDISQEFAARPYHVGVFLYPRTVGVFDPTAADWIVFLYAARER